MTTGRRVRFIADFDYKPSPLVTMAYKTGTIEYVRKECAEQAIKLGRAVPHELPAPPAGIAATIAKKPRRRKRDG
jgi:hypothetical protein